MEPTGTTSVESRSLTATLDSLTNQRRRILLVELIDGAPPIDERTLAARVAAAERRVSPSEVSTEETERVLVDLHHTQLPKLDDADLIDRTDGGVVLTGERELREFDLVERLRSWTDDDQEDVDAALAVLTDRRRRIVRSALARFGPMTPAELADHVVAVERAAVDRESVSISLRHVHLPKLTEAGLIERDGDDLTATDHSVLGSDWIGFDDRSTADQRTSEVVPAER